MTEAGDTTGGIDMSRDNRMLAARFKLVVDSLTATTFFNPVGAALECLMLFAGWDVFGRVPIANMAAAVSLMTAVSIAAWFVQRWYFREATGDLHKAERVLLVLQAVVAVAWSVVGWLFWRDGNAANNIFVGMVMICVTWSGAFARAAYRKVFLTGIVIVMALFAALFATGSGITAHILLVLTPLWTAYIIAMGAAAKRRVDDALRARFVSEDLSEALRKARDVALEKRAEAEAANAAKTAFLANMSHELRTPLNAILGFSDIIARQSMGPAAERYAEYANDIHTSGAHLLNLINDLLDVSKIEAGKMEIDPQPLDPWNALTTVKRILESKAKARDQSLTFAIAAGTPWPLADERAFHQIALNIVSNALKFTQDGGHIQVICRKGEGEGVLLVVKDDGPGIAPDKLERVFQAFSQVDNRYDRNGGGTGLGLSLVRGLINLHGGRVWIESELGHGTSVFVYFPLSTKPSENAASAAVG
ncbi:MAG: HAMP domain-containing histidine kinase [Alphaproteobacteria bacterium]|nr:HAMP domain-containing histidine kinase [Alphaproteobacteria bacterium]